MAFVSVEVEKERLKDALRFAYTVRYVAVSASGSPLVRLDVGASSYTASAELTAPPLEIESPPGWRATVIPDRSRPGAWRVAWSCAGEGWEHALEHAIRAGQTQSGFRVTAPRDAAGYGTASYFVGGLDAAAAAWVTPRGSSGRVWTSRKRSPQAVTP